MEQVLKLRKIGLTVLSLFIGFLTPHWARAVDNDLHYKSIRTEVNQVQEQLEISYSISGALNSASLTAILSSVDETMALMKRIAMDEELGEDQKGRLYEELIRGQRDNQEYGSLARLIWASMIHQGFDNPHQYDGMTTAYGTFLKIFLEVFNDARSVFIFKKNKQGQRTWGVSDRVRREKLARALAVRLFDINEILNQYEKSGFLFDYVGEQLHTVADETKKLRLERLTSEKLALTFYLGMMGMNLVSPQVLPLVQFDFIGLMYGNPWGSSLVSGAVYFLMYSGLASVKWLTRTQKTYTMSQELVRVMKDPLAELNEDEIRKAGGDPQVVKEGLLTDYKNFMKSLREGKGVLGLHRRKMIEAGYQSQNSCSALLNQLFL